MTPDAEDEHQLSSETQYKRRCNSRSQLSRKSWKDVGRTVVSADSQPGTPVLVLRRSRSGMGRMFPVFDRQSADS